MRAFSFRRHAAIFFLLCTALLGASLLQAWSGPTATAPNGNIAAPVNTGTTDQIKNAGLSVNALTVFGNGYIQNNLSIATTTPHVALEINGTLKLASGNEVCQGVTEGGLRYNSSSKILEYCNGIEWCPFSGCVHTTIVTYLTSGTTWTVPSNWNSSNNSIEVIGGGGGGGTGQGGGGGGGGAYSKITNLSLSPATSVSYAIGLGGTSGNPGSAGGDTYFNPWSGCAGSSVCAKGGTGGRDYHVVGIGGASSAGVGTIKYSGGNGGSNSGSATGTGGGGAAGPLGNGNTGDGAGNGGAGDSGAGGSTGIAGNPGTVGGTGAEWDSTHGAGGGGGGGAIISGALGGAGGTYGGGGGGGARLGAGAAGTQGLIVITYNP